MNKTHTCIDLHCSSIFHLQVWDMDETNEWKCTSSWKVGWMRPGHGAMCSQWIGATLQLIGMIEWCLLSLCAHACAWSHTHTHTPIHPPPHTHIHPHSHAHTHTHTHTHTHIHPHTHTPIHPHTHAHTPIHPHTHAHTHTHM